MDKRFINKFLSITLSASLAMSMVNMPVYAEGDNSKSEIIETIENQESDINQGDDINNPDDIAEPVVVSTPDASEPVLGEPEVIQDLEPAPFPADNIQYRVSDDAMGYLDGNIAVALAGFEFTYWTDDAGNEVSYDAVFTATSDGVYTANFRAVETPDEPEVTTEQDLPVTISEDSIQYRVSDETMGYLEGNTAIANDGFEFTYWTDENGTEISSDNTFEAEENGLYTANFKVVEYTIAYEANEGGYVTLSEEKADKIYGVTGSEAIAFDDFTFTNWTDENGNEVSTEAVYIPELKDAKYYANFAANGYTITYEAVLTEDSDIPENGHFGYVVINDNEYTDYTEGVKEQSQGNFRGATALPDDGYEFMAWLDKDGNMVSDQYIFVPTDITEDTTYTALFESIFVTTNLEVAAGEQVIKASGKMPRGAQLSVSKITYTKGYEDQLQDEEMLQTFTVYDAFDIKILVNGQEWQPVDDNATVQISISGIELPEKENDAQIEDIQVHRFEDDTNEATKLNAEVVDSEVVFETEHFTVFIIGSTSYNTDDATASWDISDGQDGSIMAYWYEDDSKLIITGSGIIKHYANNPSDPGYNPSPISQNLKDVAFSVSWVDAAGITTIGWQLFKGCSLMTMDALPDGITTISGYAFQGCSNLALTSLPDGITTIDSGAFDGCASLVLTSLPSGMNKIEGSSFAGCSSLALTELPDGITVIEDWAFQGCSNLALTTLPSGVTEIGSAAFQNCSSLALTSLPDGITTINWWTFENCTSLALTSLPDGLTEVCADGFAGCTSLALTSLPSGLTNLGTRAFWNCSSLALTALPDGMTTIANRAFGYCTNLALTTLPDSVTVIEECAFYNDTSLSFTSLPDGITSIGDHAFCQCVNLAITTLPTALVSIGTQAFDNCSNITTISYTGTSLTSIGSLAFAVGSPYDYSNRLATTLNTENSTLLNYDWAGSYRKLAKTITINGVTYDITNSEAIDISYLQDETLLAYYLESDNIVIITGAGDMKDYDPSASYGGTESPFKDYSGYTVIWDDKGITSIGDYIFSSYGGYSSYNTATIGSLPTGITKIGQHAFDRCSTFNQDIPASVLEIGNSAFSGCTALAISHLPDGLTSLGSTAFSGCSALTQMTLPSGITAIPAYLFQSCANLETVTLASGTTSIGQYAFSFCPKLSEVNNMDSVTRIGSSAFALTAVSFTTLPENLAYIGSKVFDSCTNITEMTVNQAAINSAAAGYGTDIGIDGLFAGCTNLTTLDLSGWDMSNITSTAKMIANSGVTTLTGPSVAPQDSSTLGSDTAPYTFFEKDETGAYVTTKCYRKLDQTVGKTLTKEAFIYTLALPATVDDFTIINSILKKDLEYQVDYNGDNTKKLSITSGAEVTMTNTDDNTKTFTLTATISDNDSSVTIENGTLVGDADTSEHYYTKNGKVSLETPSIAELIRGEYTGNINVAWVTASNE